jgi:hypothetical protein
MPDRQPEPWESGAPGPFVQLPRARGTVEVWAPWRYLPKGEVRWGTALREMLRIDLAASPLPSSRRTHSEENS